MTYYTKECKEVRTKKKPVSFINSKYRDGNCIKHEFRFLGNEDAQSLYIQYFCDMYGILAYVYENESCSKYLYSW